MLSALQSLSDAPPPILPYLLRGPRGCDEDASTAASALFPVRIAKLRIPPSLLSDSRQQVVEEFQLNDDQLDVLDRCIAWLQPPPISGPQSRPSPVVLVHGTFGGGKTLLLVALLVFLHRVLSAVDPRNTVRVLVACQTNVAVDGILSALLHRSYDCFVRVGSNKKIAANVLRHTLHASRAGKGVEDTHQQAVRELKGQVDDRRDRRRQQRQMSEGDRAGDYDYGDEDGGELRDMEAALAEMKAERGVDRKRRLLSKRVVAVTCAASTFEVLDGCDFPIVLLDESSQMIEPASLLPMQRFHCQRLIAVGDPKQLPPTLKDVEAASDSSVAASGDRPAAVASCLTKPLFERLHNAGLPTVLLRYQYRMHPTLSHMPNQLFYGGQLRDGVDEEARPALLRRMDDNSRMLGPLTFVNVPRGQEVRAATYPDSYHTSYHNQVRADSGRGSSWRNDSEVQVVVLTITALLQRGIPASSIGVITLYRPQWSRLKTEIAGLMTLRHEQSQAAQQSQSPNRRERARSASGAAAGRLSVEDGPGMMRISAGPVADEPAVAATKRSRRVRAEGVQVSTVDSFQGGEKDIVLLSTVRTSPSDFLDNSRRINVALTRARHHLIVVGHHSTLLQLAVWKPVVTYVSSRCPGCFFPSDETFLGALEAMQAVKLAVTVSQKEASGQQLPSENCNAAGKRRERRGGRRDTSAMVEAALCGDADDGEEQLLEDATGLSTAPGAQTVVQAGGDSVDAGSHAASGEALAAEWMDDEDAPLPLLTPFSDSLIAAISTPPVPATVQSELSQHSTHEDGETQGEKHERQQRELDGQATEVRAHTKERAVEHDEGIVEAAPSASQTMESVDEGGRLGQAELLPHPSRHQTTRGTSQRDVGDSVEADEQPSIRHRKRARLLSDEEDEGGADSRHTQQRQPVRLTRQSRQPSTGGQADAFDFERCSQRSGLVDERACETGVSQADIDIFALLRSSSARDREAEVRKQQQERREVEQSLVHVLVTEQKRQEVQARQRRAVQTQHDEDDDDNEECY